MASLFTHQNLTRYFHITWAYGLAHAMPYVWSYKTSLYRTTYNEPKRELLVVDKAGLVIVNMASAPIMWPFLLREDLIRLECFMRGKPAGEYLPASDDT